MSVKAVDEMSIILLAMEVYEDDLSEKMVRLKQHREIAGSRASISLINRQSAPDQNGEIGRSRQIGSAKSPVRRHVAICPRSLPCRMYK